MLKSEKTLLDGCKKQQEFAQLLERSFIKFITRPGYMPIFHPEGVVPKDADNRPDKRWVYDQVEVRTQTLPHRRFPEACDMKRAKEGAWNPQLEEILRAHVRTIDRLQKVKIVVHTEPDTLGDVALCIWYLKKVFVPAVIDTANIVRLEEGRLGHTLCVIDRNIFLKLNHNGDCHYIPWKEVEKQLIANLGPAFMPPRPSPGANIDFASTKQTPIEGHCAYCSMRIIFNDHGRWIHSNGLYHCDDKPTNPCATPSPFVQGQKVLFLPEHKVYEFGYIGRTGKAIIYNPGECNMQDSIAVDLSQLVAYNRPGVSKDPLSTQIQEIGRVLLQNAGFIYHDLGTLGPIGKLVEYRVDLPQAYFEKKIPGLNALAHLTKSAMCQMRSINHKFTLTNPRRFTWFRVLPHEGRFVLCIILSEDLSWRFKCQQSQ